MVQVPKVMVAVPTAGNIRHAPFIDYYLALEKPTGTLCAFSHGASPARGRNRMIEDALKENCTHILFLDDDMAPRTDCLINLLSHDLDVVTALYLMRGFPHFPLAFDRAFPNGFNKHLFLTDEKKGVHEITNCGFGCVLIKTSVFLNMDTPWVTLGELEKDGWCDDISFFNRVRAAGFKIHIDLDQPVGHIGNVIVIPNYVDGKWMTQYHTGTQETVQVPQVVPIGV